MKVSIVIRNKNEAVSLAMILNVLKKGYRQEIDEIIIVDNESTDNSIAIALKYGCKVLNISNFTYGKALNLGIEHTHNNYILLLSAHAAPIGKHFFKSALEAFKINSNIAGLRFINSFENYKRALNNEYNIVDGLNFGLMNACSMINKKVWQKHKFNEILIASEDKEWSDRVLRDGYELRDINETYFYFISRNNKGNITRWKNETFTSYQLHYKKYPSVTKLISSSLYKIVIINAKEFIKKGIYDLKMLKAKLEIKRMLK